MMQVWRIELGGTVTRDILWREVDAETEQEVREICARELPTYRVRSIAKALDPCSTPSTSRMPSTKNSSTN